MPVLAGLLAHIFLKLMAHNNGATPGYYLHILAPALALVYGLGLRSMIDRVWMKKMVTVLCAAIITFNFFILWSYMAVFSGCVLPVRNEPLYLLSPQAALGCLGQCDLVVARLDVLAWPTFGLIALGLSAGFLLIAAYRLCKQKVLAP